MRLRTTAAAVAVLGLALTGCSSSDDKPEQPSAPSSSAAPSPTVDQAAAERACKEAWRQAVEDGSASADNYPAACEGVPNSAGLGAEAIREHRAAGRKRLDDCLEDPSCTELPIP
jgi:hypothetical protein